MGQFAPLPVKNQNDKPDSLLAPDVIAQTYLDILRQLRSAWTWEIELRPWVEPFWLSRLSNIAIASGAKKFQIYGMAEIVVKVDAIAFTEIMWGDELRSAYLV